MPAITQGSRHDRRTAVTPSVTWTAWCDWFVDICLAGTVVVAPLFMGGRGAVGHFVFVLLPCLAAIAWCLRQSSVSDARWRWSGAEWLLVLGAALIVLQLTPLPPGVLTRLSPAIRGLLPMWMSGSAGEYQLGQWTTLSLTPEWTRYCAGLFLAYCLFFLVLIQRIETVADVGRLMRLLVVSVGVMAAVGLAQFFAGSERFLGIYQHWSRSACAVTCGTFQNENHFAHFLSLGLGPLIWWLTVYPSGQQNVRSTWNKSSHSPHSSGFSGDSGFVKPLLMLVLVMIALAGLLTFSRGGVLTMGIAFFACLAIMYWNSLIDRRTGMVLAAASAVNLAAMLIFGMESLSHELQSVFKAGSFRELFASRLDLWGAMCDGISQFYLVGTGIGSHREVYRIYMEQAYEDEFSHGESGYLPLLLEAGMFGLALMLIGILKSFRWCFGSLRTKSELADKSFQLDLCRRQLVGAACAIVPGLVASVVQSVADFVWYIPACMVLTVAQLACACRIYQLSRSMAPSGRNHSETRAGAARTPVSRGMALTLTAISALITWMAVQTSYKPALAAVDWQEYMKYSITSPGKAPLKPAEELHRLESMERHLSNVLKYEPENARAHLRMASLCIQRFNFSQRVSENSMDLAQIADAALASRFPSKEAQNAWLKVALGETRDLLDKAQFHSRKAVALCPLQGPGYVQLSELSFLESPNPKLKRAYIHQASQVRPYSGLVLFARGKEAALAGKPVEAFEHWKKAFRFDPEIRLTLIESLSDQLPAAVFMTSFQPDTRATWQLFWRYISKGRQEDAQLIGPDLAAALVKEAQSKTAEAAAQSWRQASDTYFHLGELAHAVECQKHAVESNPIDVDYRLHYAQLLVKHEKYEEAVDHFEWCLRRRPGDQELRNLLAEARVQTVQSISGDRVARTPPDPTNGNPQLQK